MTVLGGLLSVPIKIALIGLLITFNQLNIMVPYVDIIGLRQNVAIL